jgi:hypothetical protein
LVIIFFNIVPRSWNSPGTEGGAEEVAQVTQGGAKEVTQGGAKEVAQVGAKEVTQGGAEEVAQVVLDEMQKFHTVDVRKRFGGR